MDSQAVLLKCTGENEIDSFQGKTLPMIPKSFQGMNRIDKRLVNFVEKITDAYIHKSSLKERKTKGQFFTPKEVALFMAGLFTLNKQNIKLLDPGAGMGMLSAAFCSYLLDFEKPISLTLDAYETDSDLIPYLEKVYKECKSVLEEKGHTFEYNIIQKDFILNKVNFLKQKALVQEHDELPSYDFIISNPPYYKLNKDSPQSKLMNEFTSGQPNIYAFFMALSLEMLKPDGQMIFITPRSFCSGLYFKKFREWLLHHGIIKNIHMFESRSTVFDKDEVLQESVIFKIIPCARTNDKNQAVITTSQDKLFHDIQEMDVEYEDILHRKNGDIFIKIPTKKTDIQVQHIINSWQYTLKDLGIKISTGPVVSFRAQELLSEKFIDKNKTSPLLWMHNIQGMDVLWPIEKKKRELAIKLEKKAEPLLVPNSNYVLLKRFSSKEQKRRLYAGVLLKSKFDSEKIGIENHLNYIYKCDGMLSIEEAYGIAGILNTSIIDAFFRMMNGNTQVNAGDIMNLPMPSIEDIRKIGSLVKINKPQIGLELDKIVSDILGIDSELIEKLNKEID